MQVLAEAQGVTLYTKELIEYIQDLIDNCMGFDFEDFDRDIIIELPRILKLYKDYKKTRNNYKNYTKHEYFFGIPKTISGLDWLSTDSFINIICYQYDTEEDMDKDPDSRKTKVSSSYLIDNKSTIDSSTKYDSNLLNYLLKIRTLRNEFTGNSVAYFEFGISLYDYSDRKYIAGKEFYDVEELTPIIQHEINHVHKEKNIQTVDYKKTYNKLIEISNNSTKRYIKALIQIIYFCLPDEMNAFVEQFYIEYKKILDDEKDIDPFIKAFNRVSHIQCQEIASKTATFKRMMQLEVLLNKIKEDLMLNNQLVDKILRKIIYKLFTDFPRTESSEKFVTILIKYLEKKLFIFKRRCFKTTTLCESLKDTYLYSSLSFNENIL